MRRSAWLVAAAIIAAACDSAPATAPSPAPTAPAGDLVVSLTISGLPSNFSVGETAQLSAEAAGADGQRKDATARVAWRTTSDGCSISQSGVLSATQAGNCAIEASIGTIVAAATTGVGSARSYTITGLVKERDAPGFVPVRGATVTVTSGSLAGVTATTDANGRYVLSRMRQETVSVQATAEDLEPATIEAAPGGDAREMQLPPRMATIQWDRATAPPSDQIISTFRIPVSVRHWGTATLSVFSSAYECGTYETYYASIIEKATSRYLTTAYICKPGGTTVVPVTLAPGDYDLEVVLFFPKARTSTNTVTLSHPR